MNADFLQSLIEVIAADSIGSIIVRAIIWLILVSIVAVGTAQGKKIGRIKSEAGLFLLFIVLTGVTIYLAFGLIPTITSKPSAYHLLPISLGFLPEFYRLSKTLAYSPQI